MLTYSGQGDLEPVRRSDAHPRYFAASALAEYLARVAEPESRLRERSAALRRRPRRAGKPL